ncbi:hypothetical protein Zmor_005445 [Zophobas morio]|uniref:Uncharacterized protein n=1 Tax=Zophobas morio TaxID=2755281 RepID=A0AA38IT78_9CUCU|nr:hypothetical protein Zmor_005445 [Zophobas morio]
MLAFFEDLSKSYKCSSLWAVCEGYIDTSIENKKKTASDILGGDPGARTSTASSYNRDSSIVRREILNAGAVTNILSTKPKHMDKDTNHFISSGINISNCKECIIDVYNK